MPKISVSDIRLISISFQANESFSPQSRGVKFKFNLTMESGRVGEQESQLCVRISVSTPKSDDYPFFLSITIVGIFDLEEPVDEKLRKQLLEINCPAIIFPYLREAISDITRRAGFPPLYLPPVNFIKRAQAAPIVETDSIPKSSGDKRRTGKPRKKNSP
jgi:preprotein translocase subunit SecB